MKIFVLTCLFLLSVSGFSQIGIKGGANFANVTNASEINNSRRSGFHAGLFLSPPSTGVLGYRTEIIFSRQGYNYQTGTTTGDVNLDYLMFPQLTSINITKYISLQFGAHMAYLLNAKVDSSTGTSSSSSNSIMDLYNRFDYGFAAGVEGHPFMGLVVGARWNISLNELYKDAQMGQMPSFSDIDAKNNIIQLFAGWRFGKTSYPKESTSPMGNN